MVAGRAAHAASLCDISWNGSAYNPWVGEVSPKLALNAIDQDGLFHPNFLERCKPGAVGAVAYGHDRLVIVNRCLGCTKSHGWANFIGCIVVPVKHINRTRTLRCCCRTGQVSHRTFAICAAPAVALTVKPRSYQ